jgi:hypothetical protein
VLAEWTVTQVEKASGARRSLKAMFICEIRDGLAHMGARVSSARRIARTWASSDPPAHIRCHCSEAPSQAERRRSITGANSSITRTV